MTHTAPKLIYILGCDHALQIGGPATTALDDQRKEYRGKLRSLANAYRFSLYCEEINHSAFSIAEQFAINRRKRYVNIDMPKDTRGKLRIPPNYADPDNAAGFSSEQIIEWHEVREEYMYERATDRMVPETVALVICGHGHLQRLVMRFKKLGGRVESDTIVNEPWYQPEVFTPEYYLDS